jgi:hypothetical protein
MGPKEWKDFIFASVELQIEREKEARDENKK